MRRSWKARKGRRILILLENLPLQRDARVKRECRALLEAGYGVTVVCPRDDSPLPTDLSEVRVRSWRPPKERYSALGFVFEYAAALGAMMWLSLLAARDEGFDVIQACNPPDLLFLVAAPFKLVGVPFVFDHHDIAPEMFVARYGSRMPAVRRTLELAERATYACADRAIVTNESIKQIATTRARARPESITVVRNGPPLAEVDERAPHAELRNGRRFMCVWHGVMGGADEGLDLALEAVSHLVHDIGRNDCHFAFVGDGEMRPALDDLIARFDVSPWISLPGWQPLDVIYDYLASAHIGLAPDPVTPRTSRSTTMKVMEYMAVGLPVVSFDNHETRVSAADAAVYVSADDPRAYAKAIDDLLADPERRTHMAKVGRQRIEEELAWDYQRVKYVDVMNALIRSDS